MKRLVLLSGALCALAVFTPVLGQNYPTKPIRIIVPFSAGGPTDTHSRWAAQQLTAAFGQQVIVENRVGAGGTIGTAVAITACDPVRMAPMWGPSPHRSEAAAIPMPRDFRSR